MSTALVIPPNGKPYLKEISTYDEIKASLNGGWLELLPIPVGETGHHGYLDEEGKMKSLPYNSLATHLCALWKVGLALDDRIVGPFVVFQSVPTKTDMKDGDVDVTMYKIALKMYSLLQSKKSKLN